MFFDDYSIIGNFLRISFSPPLGINPQGGVSFSGGLL